MDNREEFLPEENSNEIDVYDTAIMEEDVPEVPIETMTEQESEITQEMMANQVTEESDKEGTYQWQKEPEPKTPLIGIVVAGSVAVLVIILIILIALELRNIAQDGIKIKLPEISINRNKEQEDTSEEEAEGHTDADISGIDTLFAEIDWDDTSWKDEHQNYTKDEVGTQYYNNVVDCIDESVPYTINREFFEYTDEERNICIRIAYIQLEGDITNLEQLNEQIKEESLYLARIYDEQKSSYDSYIDEYGGGYIANVDSYVTYNSEDILSIVLDEEYRMADGSGYLGLYGINTNVSTGALLENTEILKMDESFAADFKKRSYQQNGAIETGVDNRTDKEVCALLNSEDNLILFYTPLGMEVGYSYSIDYSIGWVTVTYKDYDQFDNAL